ncbi:MAG TPA: transglycosylase SLT domain-containing protein [Mucilaginibacter sp.]|nr:transglycosylase SLT domain-containing protein [Mucilaginibacter sp.]
MKRLFVFVIFLFLLQIVKAAPSSVTDSSRLMSKAIQANVLAARVTADTIMVPVTEPAPISFYQNNLFKKRLDSVQKEVQLDYNAYVQSYIDLYLTPVRRADIGRVLGLTKYYFPIYEKAFREAGIPEEIEYLSVVESQLNPHAVSRVGATGPWQFMSTTAKTYGLTMDNYVDERRDPVQSSYAAAAYLKDAYQEFGDWLLAIASYNCGKSNVIRAIEKAGVNDFWAIRQYLPVETRGYVPAYIAITYVMNYYKKYNIIPQHCNYVLNTDTVSVDKVVSLNSVGRELNIDPSQLAILNPAYLQQIVNGTAVSPKTLVIPQTAREQFTTSYSAMNSDMAPFRPKPVYAAIAVKKPEEQPAFVQPAVAQKVNNVQAAVSSNKKSSGEYISYRVQPGDTLPVIANKFGGTSVEELKKLNGLKSDDVQPGTMIMINKG